MLIKTRNALSDNIIKLKRQPMKVRELDSKTKEEVFDQQDVVEHKRPSWTTNNSAWIVEPATMDLQKCNIIVPSWLLKMPPMPLQWGSEEKELSTFTFMMPWVGRVLKDLRWNGDWGMGIETSIGKQWISATVGAATPYVPLSHNEKWEWNNSKQSRTLKLFVENWFVILGRIKYTLVRKKQKLTLNKLYLG